MGGEVFCHFKNWQRPIGGGEFPGEHSINLGLVHSKLPWAFVSRGLRSWSAVLGEAAGLCRDLGVLARPAVHGTCSWG